MFARYALCNLFVKPIQPVFFYARPMCSGDSKDKLIHTLQHDTTILKILNYKSHNYISRFKISIPQVNAIKMHREKHGPYKSLQDVLQVEGITESILNELLYSFMNDKQYQKGQKAKRSIIVPRVHTLLQKNISRVLGIYIGVNIVTWTLLEIKGNLLDWNYKSFSEISDNNVTLNLLETAQQLNNTFPESDLYVVDDINYDHRIAKSIRYMKPFLQKQQLRAMILAFLKNRTTDAEDESMSKIYLTQHDKVANLYGLLVDIPKNIMNFYESQFDYIQDQMNWSLLTAVTFLQLGIFGKYHCDFV